MNLKIIFLTSVALSVLMFPPASKVFAGEGHGHEESDAHRHEGEGGTGSLVFSSRQMAASGIRLHTVASGSLIRRLVIPGRIVPDPERMVQIVPKVSGTVAQILRNLGDPVKKGDVLARIESRELAEAVARYQAALRAVELFDATYKREKTLWEKKVTAEQDYLAARNAMQEARIALDLSKESLRTLGYTPGKKTPSRFLDLVSPLDGVVIERELVLGEYVDATRRAFTVADLSVLWIETSIAPGDLVSVKTGQEASVMSGNRRAAGKITFVSPVVDPATQSAKAVIELSNADGIWRSGDFVEVSVDAGENTAGLVVPNDAVQTMDGKSVVFVKTAEGFKPSIVVIGQKNDQEIEIASGLTADQEIATGKTFILKAEAEKSEAGHEH